MGAPSSGWHFTNRKAGPGERLTLSQAAMRFSAVEAFSTIGYPAARAMDSKATTDEQVGWRPVEPGRHSRTHFLHKLAPSSMQD